MDKRTSFRTLIFCTALVFLVSACSSKEEKVSKFLARGDRLAAKGDTMRAILEYKNGLQIDPKSSAAMFALGKAYLAQKEYSQAYRFFNGALEFNPDLDEARIQVATLLAPGQPQMALDELSKIRKPDSLEPRMHIVKAQALMAQKEYRKAADVLTEIPDAGSISEVQGLLSTCLKEVGDYAGMETAAARFGSLEPKNLFSYIFLAQYAAKKGDRARVVREMEAMVNANHDESTLLVRARVFEDLGLLPEAEKAFDGLPENLVMGKARAEFWQRRQNLEKAQQVLEALQKQNPGDVDTLLRLADIMNARGRMQDALDTIEKTLKLELKTADRERVLLAKASLKAMQNDLNTAREICQQILQQNQGNAEAHYVLGKILLDTGKTEEAEIHLNQVATARANDPQVQLLLARCQLLNKKDHLAADTLNAAVQANPRSDELRLGYAQMLRAQGSVEQALGILGQGLEIKPDDIALLKSRGEMLRAQGDFSKSEEDFRQMIKLLPDSSVGYLEMTESMLVQSRNDDAVEWARKALGREQGWEMAIPALSLAYQKKGDQRSALALAEAEAAKKPASGLANYYIAQLYFQKDDLPGAEKALGRVMELAPEWPDPQRLMAVIYARQGRIDTAITEMEHVYAKQPTPAAIMNLAVLYEQKGRFSEAGSLFDELLQKSNQSPTIMNDLAYLYADHRSDPGDLEKAANLAAQALAKDPQNPAIMDTAAWVAYRQGNLEKAWFNIQSALAMKPEVGPINYHAALIAQAKGEKSRAIEYIEKALKTNMDASSRNKALELKKQLEG